MQRNSTTTPLVNKERITYTKRKMTAYGGFSLIASFFERIGFAEMIEKAMPIEERSPNGTGIYGKTVAFVAMVYAGAERFSHLMYLGNKEVAMGKTLPLFANEVVVRDYRYSAWITNSTEPPYDVWTMCKPRANDENTIKESKEDFSLGGFSMKKFYAVEAAMMLRVLMYNLFLLFRYEFLGKKEKRQRLKTLRYKYLVLPAQMGRDGREAVLRISARSRKVRSKLSYLFTRIAGYLPRIDGNCSAVEDT